MKSVSASKHIDLIGFPMDLGAGRRGVDMGPSALRIANIESAVDMIFFLSCATTASAHFWIHAIHRSRFGVVVIIGLDTITLCQRYNGSNRSDPVKTFKCHQNVNEIKFIIMHEDHDALYQQFPTPVPTAASR